MSDLNAFPPHVGARLNEAAQANQLGQFRRIVQINSDETAGSSFLAAGVCALLGLIGTGILWWVYSDEGSHRYPVILWLGPLLLLAVPFFVIQGLNRTRKGNQYVGVWDGGILGTEEKLPAVKVIRFDRGTATVTISQDGDKGKQADTATLVVAQDSNKIPIVAKTDNAWYEVNDILQRFGQQPIMRNKEPGYEGE